MGGRKGRGLRQPTVVGLPGHGRARRVGRALLGGLTGRGGAGRVRQVLVAGLAGTLAVPLLAASGPGTAPPLFSAGLLGNDQALLPVALDDARGADYVRDSSVLRMADGRYRYLPVGSSQAVTVAADDPGAIGAITADRAWRAAGEVPGATDAEREAASRSLLDLRLLLRPGGAELAAQTPYWAYVWPRDASFAVAAFAVTGHQAEATEILRFLSGTQLPDGTWPSRSHPDGTPVADGRPAQLDATGWVSWAAWIASDAGRDAAVARGLWPTVRAAADAAARSLGRDELPPPGPDYWERRERQPTLGTAAVLRTGLRAAGDLAAALGHRDAASRYRSAASRLGRAISKAFAGLGGFHRYPVGFGGPPQPGDGPDAAVAWLAPPFAPATGAVRAGLAQAAARLGPGDGGAVPGMPWLKGDYWTPATATFALAEMASGDRVSARLRLRWLLDHRTSLGAFPERVRRLDGSPRSVAPLGWTGAIVLLTIASEARPLPIPGM
jgi:glucoamylase